MNGKPINKYVSDEVLENIFNRSNNFIGVVSNDQMINENMKCFGIVALLVNVEKDKRKGIEINDVIEFLPEKIKWSSGKCDEYGCELHLINPYWCKEYICEERLNVPFNVLKSEVSYGERKYFVIEEIINKLNKDQFIARKMLFEFQDLPHLKFEACKNMASRFKNHNDYYRALNETCKHYLIEHEEMKSLYGRYQRAKGKFKKEWETMLLKEYKRSKAMKNVRKIYDIYEQVSSKNKSNVIELKR